MANETKYKFIFIGLFNRNEVLSCCKVYGRFGCAVWKCNMHVVCNSPTRKWVGRYFKMTIMSRTESVNCINFSKYYFLMSTFFSKHLPEPDLLNFQKNKLHFFNANTYPLQYSTKTRYNSNIMDLCSYIQVNVTKKNHILLLFLYSGNISYWFPVSFSEPEYGIWPSSPATPFVIK